MSHSAQDRERAVQAITRRNMLEKRIKRTQRQMAALQGEARQALESSLAADEAALAEATLTFEEVKKSMRQEEEHRRWELQELLRLKAEERRSSQFPFLPGGSVPASFGQPLGLMFTLVALAAVVGGVLLLNR